MSMHGSDYLAFAREHWIPIAVFAAGLVGFILGKWVI